jgi:hypothetical protein
MAELTPQTYDESGTDLTMSGATSGGDEFRNTGDEELVIVNNDSSDKTVTVAAQKTSFEDGRYGKSTKQDQQVTVSANGGVAKMGPFSPAAFNDSNKKAQITYSDVTSLEVAVTKRG